MVEKVEIKSRIKSKLKKNVPKLKQPMKDVTGEILWEFKDQTNNYVI